MSHDLCARHTVFRVGEGELGRFGGKDTSSKLESRSAFELDAFNESAWRALFDLIETFPLRVTDGEVDTDFESEYAFHAGTIQVGRMHWISVNSELQDKRAEVRTESLVIDKPGIIQTLHWKQKESPVLKAEDWVQVDTRAVGLNFKVTDTQRSHRKVHRF